MSDGLTRRGLEKLQCDAMRDRALAPGSYKVFTYLILVLDRDEYQPINTRVLAESTSLTDKSTYTALRQLEGRGYLHSLPGTRPRRYRLTFPIVATVRSSAA